MRGNLRAHRTLSETPHTERWTSQFVLMELIQGCRTGAEQSISIQLIHENFGNVLPATEAISERALQILQQYSLSTGIRVVDAFMAAQCLESGAVLYTGNAKHYKKISGLSVKVFKPT